MARLKWIFGLGFLIIGVLIVVGIFLDAPWWRWDIFLGLIAIGTSLLFGAWSLTYQLRMTRRQRVFGSYGQLLAICRCMKVKNISPEEYIDDLYKASLALKRVEDTQKEKINTILG